MVNQMRVKIGKYISWFGPYQLAKKLLFWIPEYDENYKFTEQYNKYVHPFGEWLSETWIADFLKWINDKQTRTIKIHIDNYDIWSLDHTLALIIHPCLIKLKQKKHGTPFVYNCDIPEHLHKISEKDEGDWNQDGWEWIIDEMIWAFNQLLKDDIYESRTPEQMKQINDRIQNGTTLFGKYYISLWD